MHENDIQIGLEIPFWILFWVILEGVGLQFCTRRWRVKIHSNFDDWRLNLKIQVYLTYWVSMHILNMIKFHMIFQNSFMTHRLSIRFEFHVQTSHLPLQIFNFYYLDSKIQNPISNHQISDTSFMHHWLTIMNIILNIQWWFVIYFTIISRWVTII